MFYFLKLCFIFAQLFDLCSPLVEPVVEYLLGYLGMSDSTVAMVLTDEQKKRIEENRRKALLKREQISKARATAGPYPKYMQNFCFIFNSSTCQLIVRVCMCVWRPNAQPRPEKDNVVTVAGQLYVDTEAGFLLSEDDLSNKNKPV